MRQFPGPHGVERLRLAQAEQLAKVDEERRRHQNKLNRPVWTKINRLELLIAGGIVTLGIAWLVYVAFF